LTEEQLRSKPAGKWSAAEILEHLALAFGHTATMLRRCAAARKPMGSSPSMKQRIISTLVVDIGYIPKGREAPKMVKPSGTLGGKEAVTRIKSNLLEMDRCLSECEEKVETTGWLANHPVLGPLKMHQWPRFHWIHTKHHMKQIERMKRDW
jgi:hypothetical protein